eukprot:symbB.v1.2.026399.t1/scaffold2633.1/size74386/6
MSNFEPVTPGAAFQAEWTKWQKQLREWRQSYDDWCQVIQQLQEWDEKESKGVHGQLASIDPNFDVFAVENIMDIGEGEPLFGNFEYEDLFDWLLLCTKVELHLLVHHFRDDTGGAILDESNMRHYFKMYFRKELKLDDYGAKSCGQLLKLVQDTVYIQNDGLLDFRLPEDTPFIHFLKMTETLGDVLSVHFPKTIKTSVRDFADAMIRSSDECCICYESGPGVRALNCLHPVCTSCCRKMRALSCPLCRAEIDRALLLELRIVHLQRRGYSFDLALPIQPDGDPEFFSTQHYPAGLSSDFELCVPPESLKAAIMRLNCEIEATLLELGKSCSWSMRCYEWILSILARSKVQRAVVQQNSEWRLANIPCYLLKKLFFTPDELTLTKFRSANEQAGDETVDLKFPGAEKEREAKKKHAARKAKDATIS